MLRQITLLLLLTLAVNIFADDVIRLAPGQSQNDHRHRYPHLILKAALDATIETHGNYTIEYAKISMTRNRALFELKEGGMINVHEAPTRKEWEVAVIPIYIPIRKGLLGYRLFLIDERKQELFDTLKTVEELKKLRAGLGSQWSTTIVMKAGKFATVTSPTYEGLFGMLMLDRFDYFPRGINEIFNELKTHKDVYPKLIIEPTKSLYFVTPTYLFVSPANPELAKRIEAGLLTIIENGIFDELFLKEHGASIEQADLSNRQILTIENSQLSEKTPLSVQKFWYRPSKSK